MDDLITKIDSDIQAIARNWANPDGLSGIMLRLAKNNSYLGDLVTEAEAAMDEAKHEYEHLLDTRALGLMDDQKVSKTYAESKAKIEFKPDFENYLTAKKNYGLLKRKRDSLDTIIDTARSRLSLIKGDIRNAN